MSTDEYIEMVYRNLKGELSPEEFNTLNEMTGKSSELANLRLEIEDAWDVSGTENTVVKKEETEKLYQTITKTKNTNVRVFSLGNAIAGIAALFILACGAIWLMRDQVEIYSEEGLIRLADKSMVELREGSRLEIVLMSDKVRNVKLSGEAYFDVEEDTERPFIITTGDTEVEVLGTQFLVKESGYLVYVAVEEGRVRFSHTKALESMELTEGMKAGTNDFGEIQEVDYQNLMGWKSGMYQSEDQELAEVVEELGVIFNTTITVEDKQLLNCFISAILTADNVNEIVNQLAVQLEMDARQEGQNWILYGGKCN